MKLKKVVGVTIYQDGSVKGLLFEGNKRVTPIKTVLDILEKQKIDLSETDLEIVIQNGRKIVKKRESISLWRRLCNWIHLSKR